ncbi:MAG: purine-nucleoside phosphorylase [Bacteroidota bacterium]|nr:purine-nucleoside phosphorylase [Bacteroidota bacterium]
MLRQIKEATEFIFNIIGNQKPEVGIILGTGLGQLASEIEIQHSISYQDIPNFPISTVESHAGRLLFGTLSGKQVVAMQGRFHFYEGYTMQQVVFPVRVMKYLGITNLMVSNACGSLIPEIKAGDLMVINDHINLLPGNPLIGKNDDDLGPRFPDMSNAYTKALVKKGVALAETLNIPIHTGVYVAVCGPNLETAAEYKYLKIIGGSVVGMSTVPEVIAAAQMGLPVFAISVITDEGWHEHLQPITLSDVIRIASATEPKMTQLLKELIALL